MSELLIRPEKFRNRTEDFGYAFLSFSTRKLEAGQEFRSETAGRELAIVVLGGVCSVTSSRGDWQGVGQRETVFDGLPYTLYLPIRTMFSPLMGASSRQTRPTATSRCGTYRGALSRLPSGPPRGARSRRHSSPKAADWWSGRKLTIT